MKKFFKNAEEIQKYLSEIGLDISIKDIEKAIKKGVLCYDDYFFTITFNKRYDSYKLED